MNVKLLRQIKKHILAQPKRYSFDWLHPSDEVKCGTQGCIAGWAVVLGNKQRTGRKWFGTAIREEATKLLKITTEQAQMLFCYWPEQFNNTHDNAKVAAKRIDHFIKTKGRE